MKVIVRPQLVDIVNQHCDTIGVGLENPLVPKVSSLSRKPRFDFVVVEARLLDVDGVLRVAMSTIELECESYAENSRADRGAQS